jgi:anti-anti-sigma regulatory factor
MAGTLTLLLDRFSGTLRGALAQASTREQELERLRVSLEQQVYERTATLQVTVDQLRASQATIDALGAPILPVLPGVLVAPLIGTIDAARLTTIADKLLAAVAQQRAHAVILDLTGVADMDAAIADGFRHLSSAVGLIGARTLVVGISPAVAQALVDLDVDLTAVSVAASLQEAVALLQSAGQQTPQRRL